MISAVNRLTLLFIMSIEELTHPENFMGIELEK